MAKTIFSIIILVIFLNSYHASPVKDQFSKNIKADPAFDTYPEQVHLAFGASPSQMIVTWVTLDFVNESIVEYGINNFKSVQYGTVDVFTDGGSQHRNIYIHRVILDDLQPDQTYSKPN